MKPRQRVPRRALLALAAVLLALPAPATATVMKQMSIEELAQASTDVVRGTVLGQVSRWTPDREGILTYVDILIHERLKGHRLLPPVVQLILPGGELAGPRMQVIGLPHFRDGEEAFVFLAPYSDDPAESDHVSLVGGKMGRLPIVPDPDGGEPFALRDLAGVEFAQFEEDRGGRRLSVKPAPLQEPMRLSDFRARVLAAGSPSGSTDEGGRP